MNPFASIISNHMEKKINKAIEACIAKIDDAIQKVIHRYCDVGKVGELLADESKLYNEDGTLTKEYQAILEKIESSLKEEKKNETVQSTDEEVLTEKDAMEFVLQLQKEKEEFMRKYDEAAEAEGFDPEKWMTEIVGEEGMKQINSFEEDQIRKIIESK